MEEPLAYWKWINMLWSRFSIGKIMGMPNSTCLSCMCYVSVYSVCAWLACTIIIFKSLWELDLTWWSFVWNYKSSVWLLPEITKRTKNVIKTRTGKKKNYCNYLLKHSKSVLAENKSSHRPLIFEIVVSQTLNWANSAADKNHEMLLKTPEKDCKLRLS